MECHRPERLSPGEAQEINVNGQFIPELEELEAEDVFPELEEEYEVLDPELEEELRRHGVSRRPFRRPQSRARRPRPAQRLRPGGRAGGRRPGPGRRRRSPRLRRRRVAFRGFMPNPPPASEDVRWVQSTLNQVMGIDLAVNGIMGPATRNAVRDF